MIKGIHTGFCDKGDWWVDDPWRHKPTREESELYETESSKLHYYTGSGFLCIYVLCDSSFIRKRATVVISQVTCKECLEILRSKDAGPKKV